MLKINGNKYLTNATQHNANKMKIRKQVTEYIHFYIFIHKYEGGNDEINLILTHYTRSS